MITFSKYIKVIGIVASSVYFLSNIKNYHDYKKFKIDDKLINGKITSTENNVITKTKIYKVEKKIKQFKFNNHYMPPNKTHRYSPSMSYIQQIPILLSKSIDYSKNVKINDCHLDLSCTETLCLNKNYTVANTSNYVIYQRRITNGDNVYAFGEFISDAFKVQYIGDYDKIMKYIRLNKFNLNYLYIFTNMCGLIISCCL